MQRHQYLILLLSVILSFFLGHRFQNVGQGNVAEVHRSERPGELPLNDCQPQAPLLSKSITKNNVLLPREELLPKEMVERGEYSTRKKFEEIAIAEAELLKSEQRTSEFQIWVSSQIARDSKFNIEHEMNRKFSAEEKDASWSIEAEDEISSMFYNEEALGEFALQGVECRSTQCRVDVAISDLRQANAIIEVLSNSFSKTGDYRELVAAPNHIVGSSAIFVSRDAGGLSINSEF
ncbi:hypothetical protein [Teredinibacter haidensis]|uniref:hypothetical protein n=1 Tax=Teredinibacter haidensis TaxID=2731755 RepID=UPI000948CB7A|nr:hypothetical protein [Teredinibacter haidensis]